jgi:hypothetical protein
MSEHRRYNRYGAHRTFAGHKGWIEDLVVIQIPVSKDSRSREAEISHCGSGNAVEQRAPRKLSKRQIWLQRQNLRNEVSLPDKEARVSHGGVQNTMEGSRRVGSHVSEEGQCGPLASTCQRVKATLGAKDQSWLVESYPGTPEKGKVGNIGKRSSVHHAKHSTLVNCARNVRTSFAAEELPEIVESCVADSHRPELESYRQSDIDKYARLAAEVLSDRFTKHNEGVEDLEPCHTAELAESVGDKDEICSTNDGELWSDENEVNVYIFTACASGVVNRWALDRQLQCDRYEVTCYCLSCPLLNRGGEGIPTEAQL